MPSGGGAPESHGVTHVSMGPTLGRLQHVLIDTDYEPLSRLHHRGMNIGLENGQQQHPNSEGRGGSDQDPQAETEL